MRMKMKKLICVCGGHSSGQLLAPTCPSWRWAWQPDRPWLLGPWGCGHPVKDGQPGPRPRAPASVLGECQASLPVQPGRMLSVSSGCCRPMRKEGAGGPRPAASRPSLRCQQVPHFLTRMARKTGKRRIHQKPMLSLLVQHLQGGACSCPGSLVAPRPLIPWDLISASGKEGR